MTDHDWQTSNDPVRMLEFARSRNRLNPRKARLFMCACCRRHWHLLPHWASQKAVEAGEQFAEDRINAGALRAAVAAAELYPEPFVVDWNAAERSLPLLYPPWRAFSATAAAGTARACVEGPTVQVFLDVLTHAIKLNVSSWDAWLQWRIGRAHTEVVRHILGPLTAPPTPAYGWPAHVSELAAAVDAGDPFLFALHDALLDAGHPDLAEHFRDPDERHPKGCWALDALLGKG